MAINVLGLSTLHQAARPIVPIPCFDIVLVHEFGGHPAQTWEPLRPADDGSDEWPNARVLTFGYNETSHHPYGREELLGHAERLLWGLSQQRKEEDTRLRPIVFIGRGAGGIIIKKALITARLDTRYKDISSLTLGVVFDCTPHEATLDMSWDDITSAMSRARPLNQGLQGIATMDVLRPDDAVELSEISAAFVRIPGLLLLSDMEVGQDVDVDTKVMRDALPGGLDVSSNPRLLSEVIKLMQDESPKAKNGALSTEHHRALQLLRPHKVRREQAPSPPTRGTCSWIEAKEPFREWWHRDLGRRLLWIRGDMGCGKTYLARHIVRLAADPPPSKKGRHRPETVAYCCIGDMVDGYKTPEAVLAWLLHELLIARPELEPAAKLKGSRLVCDFTFYDVQQLWGNVIIEATKDGRHLTLVVDEIDQLDIEGSVLDDFFGCITCHDLPIITSGRVRLLVLSRHQERLEAVLGSCNFSRYDITADDTSPDIAKTTNEALAVIRRYPNGSAIAHDIEQQIEKGANGMYLWAQLALGEAIKRLAPNNQQAGSKLTHGIFPLFDQYLEQFSKSSKQGDGNFPRNVLFWLTYQAEPMYQEELQIACALVDRVGDIREPKWPEVDVGDPEVEAFLSRHPNLKRDVLERCAPLVKIGLDGRIGAVHRSLQEYLRTPPPSLLLPNHKLYHCNEKHSNRNISFLCADYLLQPAFQVAGAGIGTSVEEHETWLEKVEMRVMDYPFVRYASLFWIYHAQISGSPFDVDLAQWKEAKHRRLLDIGSDSPHNAHALCWAEVWWETTGKGEGFPGPALDLGANFPDEGRRLDDGGWEEQAALAAWTGTGSVGDGDDFESALAMQEEELALAREVEVGLAGLMRWMGQLKTDVNAKMQKGEQIIKDLQRLQTLVGEGAIDPDKVFSMVKELEDKVEAAKREVHLAKEEAESARAQADERNQEYENLQKRHAVMVRSMQALRESLQRSKEVLAKQKTDRSSWIPFRR